MITSPYQPPHDLAHETPSHSTLINNVREFIVFVSFIAAWVISLDGLLWGSSIGLDLNSIANVSRQTQAYLLLLVGEYLVFSTSLFLLANGLRGFQRSWVGLATATLVTATAISWYFQLEVPSNSLWMTFMGMIR
ncbi:hypothetical protein [Rhodopirellula sp. MGV]|uniref:hypothetical protein n=1 Tax=Rhodopirellula sp. MGV TaxID=2023130 RepID=UPI001179BD3B|nr:hypothetical protein [Rhodopirellula sp. MGV]